MTRIIKYVLILGLLWFSLAVGIASIIKSTNIDEVKEKGEIVGTCRIIEYEGNKYIVIEEGKIK